MISTTQRRYFTGIAVVAAVALISAPAALAVDPPAPAAAPVCGAVVGVMNHTLADFVSGAKGKNYVSIPRVSDINVTPENQSNNGFHQICDRLGLSAPPSGLPADLPSIDGDLVPDNAVLLQYNALAGTVATYQCNQVISSDQWDEGAAVEIRPALSIGTSVPLIVEGVECSQKYAIYRFGLGKGNNLFPIPLTTTCAERGCICTQLNLATGTQVQTIDAATGNPEDFNCGQVDTFPRGFPIGEAARIRSTAGTTAGQPLNCLSGLPCPATPSNDYPAPLVF
jgi:hypothetical protein